MGRRKDAVKEWWRRLRHSSRFHDGLVFLIFVVVSALFWGITALNDSVTQSFKVRMVIQNVPDTVTFINVPPADFSVTVRDKGTRILRSGLARSPEVDFNFRDYANDGILRLTRGDISAALKQTFGNTVQISSVSLDSLRLYYSDQRGKRVPVSISMDVTAASGYVISGNPRALQSGVRIYSYGNETDSIRSVKTEKVTRRNLKETTQVSVKLMPIKGVRVIPDEVTVEIPVEPLVRREGFATVETDNVPAGQSLLLFPNKVPVSYYVPMSLFNNNDIHIAAKVDYNDVAHTTGSRLPVRLYRYPSFVINPELESDSIEYTIMLR